MAADCCAKLKLFLIQIVVTLILDSIPRFWRWLTCRSAEKELRVRVTGAPAVRSQFHLDAVDGLVYPDPPYCADVATIVCAFRPQQPVPYERITTDGPDGNPICLDFFFAGDEAQMEADDTQQDYDDKAEDGVVQLPKDSPALVLIIPGLASFSSTNYIERLVWQFHRQGFHVCVMNARGLGDTPLQQPRLMSGAWTGDVRHLSLPGNPLHRDALEARCGVQTKGSLCIIGAGFSLGGVILAKFVGEEGERVAAMTSHPSAHAEKGANGAASYSGHPFDALLVVNSPLDTPASSMVMRTRGFNKRFYDPNMADGLVSYVRGHKELLADLPGLSEEVRDKFQKGQWEEVFKRINSIYDYDLYINAGANGFSSPDEYYNAVSPVSWLKHVRVPVLCINAADDPVIGPPPVQALRTLMQTTTPHMAYIEVPFGGHLGYIKPPLREWKQEPSFMEKLVVRLSIAFTMWRQHGDSTRKWTGHEPLEMSSTTAVSFSEAEDREVELSRCADEHS